MTITHDHTARLTGSVLPGLLGGLAGGVAFGAAMQAMGMMPMVAALVGAGSSGIGWLVHLAISVALGVGYAATLARVARNLPAAVGLGMAFGAFWWVIGALLLMPLRLGMPTFEVSATTLKSLVGHLMYGAIVGVVARLLAARHER